jgi:ribosomal-protein-alanine N-acetyltransferase
MLRVLTEKDLPDLLEIEAATQVAPWSRDIFERCFQLHCRGWVIEVAGKVVGFILVMVQIDECHILNFGVLPAYQKQGFGQQLLESALGEVKQQDISIAYLEVRKSNQRAISLYEKAGFKKIGERKQYYSAAEGREDAVVYAKYLT